MRIRRRHVVLTSATLVLGLLPGCAPNPGKPTSSPPLPVGSLSGRPGGWHGTMVDKPALATPPGTFRTTAGQAYQFTRPPRDEVTVVFFGFTHCHDVCPTTMADLAAARRSLRPSVAEGLHVVFVTVDPKRDTPPVLHRWLTRYDPSFVGLRGSEATVHAAERSLYAPVSGTTPRASPRNLTTTVVTTVITPVRATKSTTPGLCTCSAQRDARSSTPVEHHPRSTRLTSVDSCRPPELCHCRAHGQRSWLSAGTTCGGRSGGRSRRRRSGRPGRGGV